MTPNDLHSWLTSALRVSRGFFIRSAPSRQPSEPVHLYEFEPCPFSRKVREVLSELDLAYVSHPCARGSNNRAIVQQRGGKALFPYLVDPSTGAELYESEAIINYLFATYGGVDRSALDRVMAPLNTATSALASGLRPRGGRALAGAADRKQPEHLLELYSFEISPYCRKVREALCELNLDCLVHNVAKRGLRRPALLARGGKVMVPYLIDPNTGTELYESDDIVAYLHRTYGAGAALTSEA